MPTFSSAQVTDPFLSQNELLAPMLAHLDSQYKLGNLDINRQTLALEQDKAAREKTFGEGLLKAANDGSLSGTTGTTGATPGGGGSFLGALAQIESGDKNIVSGVDTDSQGRTAAQGGNASEISQGHFQIQTATWRDFAKQAGVDVSQYPNAMSAPREIQAQVASVIPFSRFGPRTQKLMRQQFGDFDSNRTVGELAGLGPRVAPAAPGARAATPPVVAAPVAPPPILNPNAGPRIGLAPPPVTQQAGQLPVPPIPPAVVPPPTATTGQADDPNTAAVKQASAALLNMPEPDAAAAYPGVVRELQARGLAMQAPPTYPGHAALQALVGGGDATAAAVEPSRQAMRLGGTDVAGPPGVVPAPPEPAPNRMAYGTSLPGVTIGMPGNGLAPPPTAAAPVVTAAAPTTAPPGVATPTQPPPAPTRVIPREPTIQSGVFAGLTRTQATNIAQAAAGGAKPAQVMQDIATQRHQNDVERRQDAADVAAEQQANYARQHQYQQDQIAAATRADTQRHQSVEEARQAEELRIKLASEKRAADEAAQTQLQKSKSDDADSIRVLQAIAPKIRAGVELTPEESDQYDLHRRRWAVGPVQQVPDGRGGTMLANVGREISDRFPPLPGQREYAGLKPIPGTEKQPDFAPANAVTAMLDIGEGNRKIVKALDRLEAYPGGIGPIPGSQPVTMSNWTDPEGVKVRAAVGDVQGHIYHTLAGSAQSAQETSRLRTFVPGETDDAEAAKTKLRSMLDSNRQTLLDHYRAFGPDAGGRRMPGVEEEILATIPEAAVEELKTKPDLAKAFDRRFGRGAAKLALQNG